MYRNFSSRVWAVLSFDPSPTGCGCGCVSCSVICNLVRKLYFRWSGGCIFSARSTLWTGNDTETVISNAEFVGNALGPVRRSRLTGSNSMTDTTWANRIKVKRWTHHPIWLTHTRSASQIFMRHNAMVYSIVTRILNTHPHSPTRN